MSISRNTVVGGFPTRIGRGGKLLLSEDESETDPSDVETAVHSLVSHKDKDIFGNTKQKVKHTSEFILMKKAETEL